MTPAQLDHLRRIDAHLARLLDIAAKRTPGRWHGKHGNDLVYRKDWIIAGAFEGEYVTNDCPIIPDEERHANAAFIASCAGNAEAGWKATRAAIAWLDRMGAMMGLNSVEQKLADSILAAFPLESLK